MPGLSGAEPAWVTRRRVHLTLDVHLIDCVPEEAVETLVTCSHMLEMLNIHFHRFLPRNDFDFSIFIILSRPLPFHCNQYSVRTQRYHKEGRFWGLSRSGNE